MKNILISIITAFSLFTIASAQNPGELDDSFGMDGFALDDPYANTGEIFADMVVHTGTQ